MSILHTSVARPQPSKNHFHPLIYLSVWNSQHCAPQEGATIKCGGKNCTQVVHPLCARNSGGYLTTRDVGGRIVHKGFCQVPITTIDLHSIVLDPIPLGHASVGCSLSEVVLSDLVLWWCSLLHCSTLCIIDLGDVAAARCMQRRRAARTAQLRRCV